MAFFWLTRMGFDKSNVRRAFGKLTGITHIEIARRNGVERQIISKNITGERKQPHIQAMIADAWDVPVEMVFDNNHGSNDNVAATAALQK